MKVWMVIWSYYPEPEGGAEHQCRLICPFLIDQGVDITIVTARLSWQKKRSISHEKSDVSHLGLFVPLFSFLIKNSLSLVNLLLQNSKHDQLKQILSFWLVLPWVWLSRLNFMLEFAIFAKMSSKDIAVYHVHETGWLGAFVSLVGKLFSVPVLCKEATYPSFPPLGWDVPFHWFLRRYQKQAHYIALNSTVKKDIIANGCPSEKVTVISNAVLLPENISRPERSKVVLYVGNFSQGAHQKGFDVLFKAWKQVTHNTFDLKLVMAGGGASDSWQSLVRELGCEESVLFAGFVDTPSTLYLEAAMLVLPSRVEGMSNALLEAMSFGLPVVVSDIPANLAVVENGRNGLVVAVNDSPALADAIIDFMQNPTKRKEFGRCGREIVGKRYNPTTVSSDLVDFYGNISTKRLP